MEVSRKVFQEIVDQIQKEMGKKMDIDEVVYGFLIVVNEVMI